MTLQSSLGVVKHLKRLQIASQYKLSTVTFLFDGLSTEYDIFGLSWAGKPLAPSEYRRHAVEKVHVFGHDFLVHSS